MIHDYLNAVDYFNVTLIGKSHLFAVEKLARSVFTSNTTHFNHARPRVKSLIKNYYPD